jgi:hypothetical protein
MQPTNVIALNNLAYALAVRHNAPAEALPLEKRAFGLAPRSALVLDTLGWVEHLLGNQDVAAVYSGRPYSSSPVKLRSGYMRPSSTRRSAAVTAQKSS